MVASFYYQIRLGIFILRCDKILSTFQSQLNIGASLVIRITIFTAFEVIWVIFSAMFSVHGFVGKRTQRRKWLPSPWESIFQRKVTRLILKAEIPILYPSCIWRTTDRRERSKMYSAIGVRDVYPTCGPEKRRPNKKK